MCCVGLCEYGWTICYNFKGGKGVGWTRISPIWLTQRWTRGGSCGGCYWETIQCVEWVTY